MTPDVLRQNEMAANDMTLLREYAASQSETAFAALVERHIHHVHSAAMRQVGDAHLAEEVTQAAFIALASKASKLKPNTILAAWLYRATHFIAINAMRTERRRQIREQEAYMQSTLTESEENVWTEIAPLLDGALNKLGETDRAALVLKFFEKKSAKQIAEALHLKEDAAQKRIGRALEKLRAIFVKNGVTETAATIAGAISANSIQVAPAALIKTTTAVALAKGATASTSGLTLAKAVLKLMAWTKAKISLAIMATVVLAGTTAFFLHSASLASIDGTFRSVLFKREYQQYANRFTGIWEGKIAIQMNSGPWTQYRRVVVKILEDNGDYHAVVDEIDDGRKNIFVLHMTLDKLAINFSSDAFSYHGVFHKDGTEIRGVWTSPIGSYVLVLTRTNNPDTVSAPLVKEDYAPRPDSDLQGVWKTVFTNGSIAQPVYLKIAEMPDGTLRAECERLGQSPIIPFPVTDIVYKKPQLSFGAWAMGGTFNNGVMNESNSAFTGQWHQMRPFAATKNLQVVWTRVNPDDEELALQTGKNFESASDTELQGHWHGSFTFGVTLNLDLNIARLSDGTYSATLDSPDQSLFAMPANVLEFKPPKLRLEVKDDHCIFDGRLTDGKLSGTWSFQNISKPVVLERTKP